MKAGIGQQPTIIIQSDKQCFGKWLAGSLSEYFATDLGGLHDRSPEDVHATADGRTTGDATEDHEVHDVLFRILVLPCSVGSLSLLHHFQCMGTCRTHAASKTKTQGYAGSCDRRSQTLFPGKTGERQAIGFERFAKRSRASTTTSKEALNRSVDYRHGLLRR